VNLINVFAFSFASLSEVLNLLMRVFLISTSPIEFSTSCSGILASPHLFSSEVPFSRTHGSLPRVLLDPMV
jgi:hypothetical protein